MSSGSRRHSSGSDELSIAQLLRCAADGELTPAQQERLEAHLAEHPEDQQRIDFERNLRESVAQSLGAESAPASLRDSVAQTLEGYDGPTTIGGRATTSRSFWSGGRGFLAIAAIVVMAMTVSIIVRSTSTPLMPQGWSDYGAQAVSFVEGAHDRCMTDSDHKNAKLVHRNVEEATKFATSHLGEAPTSLDIGDTGYEFVGLGRCGVPGGGSSVHLIYRSVEDPDQEISVFIQHAPTDVTFATNELYCADEASSGANPCFIWRNGDLVYYIVSPNKPAPESVRRALKAPGHVIHLS